MPWVTIGKVSVCLLAMLAVYAVLAITAIYWTDVYRIIAQGAVGLWLYLLIFRPGPRS